MGRIVKRRTPAGYARDAINVSVIARAAGLDTTRSPQWRRQVQKLCTQLAVSLVKVANDRQREVEAKVRKHLAKQVGATA